MKKMLVSAIFLTLTSSAFAGALSLSEKVCRGANTFSTSDCLIAKKCEKRGAKIQRSNNETLDKACIELFEATGIEDTTAPEAE